MKIFRRVLAVLVPFVALAAVSAAGGALLLAPSGRLSLPRAVAAGLLLAVAGNIAGLLAVRLAPGNGRVSALILGALAVVVAIAAPDLGAWRAPIWFRLFALALLLPGMLLTSFLCDRSREGGRCVRAGGPGQGAPATIV